MEFSAQILLLIIIPLVSSCFAAAFWKWSFFELSSQSGVNAYSFSALVGCVVLLLIASNQYFLEMLTSGSTGLTRSSWGLLSLSFATDLTIALGLVCLSVALVEVTMRSSSQLFVAGKLSPFKLALSEGISAHRWLIALLILAILWRTLTDSVLIHFNQSLASQLIR